MKTHIYLTFIAAFFVNILVAQITEGRCSYKIEASSDDPDMQLAIGMLQGSSFEVIFKEKHTRSEMKMGSMLNITTISNENSGDVLLLMSGMVGDNAIRTTTQEIDNNNMGQGRYHVELLNEERTIMGYTCKKAILTDADGFQSIFWYTDQIVVAKKGQSYLNEEVPGFPLEYEINNSGLKMVMTVTELDKKLTRKSKGLFELVIPEGYKVMTMDELQNIGL